MAVADSASRMNDITELKPRIYFIKMSRTFKRILNLVERKKVMIADHGYDELAQDAILK